MDNVEWLDICSLVPSHRHWRRNQYRTLLSWSSMHTCELVSTPPHPTFVICSTDVHVGEGVVNPSYVVLHVPGHQVDIWRSGFGLTFWTRNVTKFADCWPFSSPSVVHGRNQ